jgi:FkbM family methyltransferase
MIKSAKDRSLIGNEESSWTALYANRYLRRMRRGASMMIAPLLPKEARWVRIRGGILKGGYINAELRHGEKAYWLGVFEPEVQAAIQVLAREHPGLDTVYDIGAHIGFHAMALVRCFPHAHVFAFEPNPQNRKRLALNIARNGLEGRITPMPHAVSNNSQEARFYVGASTWSGGLVREHRENYSQELSVMTTSLDEMVFTKALPPPQLIKIDAEGAEAQVIRGAARVLRVHKPAVMAELHHSETGREVLTSLREMQYDVEVLSSEKSESADVVTHHVLARKRLS